MNPSNKFTSDEWKVLSDTPVVVGKAMISVSHSGVIGSTEELKTLTNSIKDLAKQKSSNPLLNELGADLQNKVSITKDLGNTLSDELRSIIKKPANTDARDLALAACTNASTILSKTSNEDAQAYKQFVVSMANKVAESAREGGLLHKAGGKVSPEEKKMLDDIKVSFGMNV